MNNTLAIIICFVGILMGCTPAEVAETQTQDFVSLKCGSELSDWKAIRPVDSVPFGTVPDEAIPDQYSLFVTQGAIIEQIPLGHYSVPNGGTTYSFKNSYNDCSLFMIGSGINILPLKLKLLGSNHAILAWPNSPIGRYIEAAELDATFLENLIAHGVIIAVYPLTFSQTPSDIEILIYEGEIVAANGIAPLN